MNDWDGNEVAGYNVVHMIQLLSVTHSRLSSTSQAADNDWSDKRFTKGQAAPDATIIDLV